MDTMLPLKTIYPNPGQPRKVFDAAELSSLAQSIKEKGLLQPIIVTPRNGFHMIIAGERRWRACHDAGLAEVPVRIIEADDHEVEELALLENVQRQDLNVLEEARAYAALLTRMTIDELATKLGKTPFRITERTTLLNLSDDIQKLVIEGGVSPVEAYHMGRVPKEKQHFFLKQIQSGRLKSRNQIRQFADGLLATQDALFALQAVSAEELQTIRHFEQSLGSIRRFLESVAAQKRVDHLAKLSFHSSITTDEIDAVITALQKVRLAVLRGKGIKDASEEVTNG
jgi:ParB family transcriptional regulator, chromosome partitioning protein